ncbi:gata zinc finger domain-containing protein [Moniliophthora roreri]|nr:gata zinc finger domain-containing protein [Moniliophthora roreri]
MIMNAHLSYDRRHSSASSYSTHDPMSTQSGAWSYNDPDSFSSHYTSFSTRQNHPHVGVSDYWLRDSTSQSQHLGESYSRNYYNGSSARFEGAPYSYPSDDRLLYSSGEIHTVHLPKIASTSNGVSWPHSQTPALSSQRSQSDSMQSRWSPTDSLDGSDRRASLDSSPDWQDIILPSVEPYESKPIIHSLDQCSPLSTISSPSPSPSPVQLPASGPKNPPKQNTDGKPAAKMCSHCRATSTPLWRREPTTLKPLCNACGLYLQQRNKLRPQELIDADFDDENSDESGDGTGPECSHCHTRNTSVWRRSKTGEQLCNACGVYSRLRGKDRPLSLRRNKIKPRTKHAAKS